MTSPIQTFFEWSMVKLTNKKPIQILNRIHFNWSELNVRTRIYCLNVSNIMYDKRWSVVTRLLYFIKVIIQSNQIFLTNQQNRRCRHRVHHFYFKLTIRDINAFHVFYMKRKNISQRLWFECGGIVIKICRLNDELRDYLL